MLNVAIAEDEEKYIEEISGYLARCGEEGGEEIRTFIFRNGRELLDHYEPKYDVILLDIEMPEMNGMEAAKKIRETDRDVVLIFITNLANYAIRGYEVGALDFITKPLSWYTFSLRFRRAAERAAMHRDEEILLNVHEGVEKISVRDIYYVEVQNRFLRYHTTRGVIELRGTMKSAEEQLLPHHFAKCNHWYIVNLMHVKRITKDTVFVGNEELEMSRRARNGFLSALTAYMGGGIHA
ncbi:MAG: LytTR family DNA-binding domain-containing protein [Lachnospiraceae bacterium]|nr:LytTR family DNA-binding domain-containing protein [Lachnospiraceae bacterium]